MYFISAVLSGIKLTHCIINAHRKTVENKKALVSAEARKNFHSLSLKKNQFLYDKQKKLFEKISKMPTGSTDLQES